MRFSDEFDRQRGGKQAKQIEQISGCFALPLQHITSSRKLAGL